MQTPIALLKFVAKAVGNAFGGGIAGDFLVEVLPGIAQDVWDWWGKDRNEHQRRVEMEQVARMPATETRRQVEAIVREVLADKPPEVRQMVAAYLCQLPATVRKSLRRPTDPEGLTTTPELVPMKAEDLLRLLPPRLPRFQPGTKPLPGVDWQLEELLGVGGFGEVWKARNPNLPSSKPVALKFCLDATAARMLQNEASILDRVMRQGKHPGIVQLQHTYLSADPPCLEYEYVNGGDLVGIIAEWHAKQKPSPDKVTKVMLRLAEIVGYAHQLDPPIVHRDLKPANVLVQQSGDGKLGLRIADFGIGGLAANQSIQKTRRGVMTAAQMQASTVRGSYTPLYASPQQMQGGLPDPRDDVFALGVIWHQLLTGDLATGRPGGRRWVDRLAEQGMSPKLIDMLASCLEDDAADRPADAAILAKLIGGHAKTRNTASRFPDSSRSGGGERVAPKKRGMGLLIAGVVAVLLVAGAGVLWLGHGTTGRAKTGAELVQVDQAGSEVAAEERKTTTAQPDNTQVSSVGPQTEPGPSLEEKKQEPKSELEAKSALKPEPKADPTPEPRTEPMLESAKDQGADVVVGKWTEKRPGTPVGDRIRTFQKDGKLVVYMPKSQTKVDGSWRRDGDKIYFREPPMKDKWFTIVSVSKDELIILMEGQRRYSWVRAD